MLRAKIVGAGSIGNHLANACRSRDWAVTVCDIDAVALDRMREKIYPSRYGKWDDAIRLFQVKDAPKGEYDVIFIGTPPDSHTKLALEAIEENPQAVFIEKPACTPNLEESDLLFNRLKERGIKGFVGYNHVLGVATKKAEEVLKSGIIGTVLTIDVEFREHWEGIFHAHPWLKGPGDSYLGFWKRGGGAGGEHSHGLNLFEHFSRVLGFGKTTEVTASAKYVTSGVVDYDEFFFLHLKTEEGLVGRVVQDVVTLPVRKRARIQGTEGALEWVCGFEGNKDAVILHNRKNQQEVVTFEKTRRDDFIEEIKHIEEILTGKLASSAIDIECGLRTMLSIAAGHLSAQKKRVVRIDHDAGFSENSLKLVEG